MFFFENFAQNLAIFTPPWTVTKSTSLLHQPNVVSSALCDIPLEHGWPSRGNALKEAQLHFSQQLSATSRFLIRCETSCLPPSFMLRFGLAWDCMGLVRVCCHNFSEFLCVAALLCLENTVFLYSSTSSDSYNFSIFWNHLEPWEERVGPRYDVSYHRFLAQQ